MKPKNFPGKKQRRKARADARVAGLPHPEDDPAVTDKSWRIGASARVTGQIPRFQRKDGRIA